MSAPCRLHARSIALFTIPIVLILYGCAPTIPTEQPTPLIPHTGPTVPEPTEVVATATEASSQIVFTPLKFTAKVFEGGNAETKVQQNEQLSLEPGDRIEISKMDGKRAQAHSVLNIQDALEIELFSDTVVLLDDIKQAAGTSNHVTLNLSRGHLYVRMHEQSDSRVTVETTDSIINTFQDDAEFNICKVQDEFTCVEVKKGSVELVTHGKKEIVKAGEARFIFQGELPSPSICAPREIFVDWENRFREYADTPPLSAVIASLQELCVWQNNDLPPNARILYQDHFTTVLSGWLEEKAGNFLMGYSTPEYYHVQIQAPKNKTLIRVPNQRLYEDVNVDLGTFTANAKRGDFQYGVVFRWSGDQYYAFTISPSTKKWFVLKSSSDGLEILKESPSDEIQGLEDKDILRVASKGPVFAFYLNNQLVYQLSDADYERGEVGLFIQTIDSPSAMILFDSITVWDIAPPPVNSTPLTNENCFNDRDDDGDRFVDRNDPDCNKLDLLPLPTYTLLPGQPPIATTIPPPSEEPPTTPTIEPPTEPPPTEEPTIVPPTEIPTEPPPAPPTTEEPTIVPPTEPPPTDPPPPPTEPPTEPPIEY